MEKHLCQPTLSLFMRNPLTIRNIDIHLVTAFLVQVVQARIDFLVIPACLLGLFCAVPSIASLSTRGFGGVPTIEGLMLVLSPIESANCRRF